MDEHEFNSYCQKLESDIQVLSNYDAEVMERVFSRIIHTDPQEETNKLSILVGG